MSVEILSFGNTDKKNLKRFVKFPLKLYKIEEKFVPPLNMELLGNKLFKAVGLLTKEHPFHEHADVIYFLALKNKKVCGRISAHVNYNHIKFHNEKAGFFGFFECINDKEVAAALFNSAKAWLREKGMEIARGPANFSSNEGWGLLVENFEDYPMLYTSYNKKYYESLILNEGFEKSMDLVAQLMPVMDRTDEEKNRRARLEKISEKVKTKNGIMVRPVRLDKHFDEDLEHVMHIYQNAWGKNWGFVPLTKHEFDDLAVGMKALLLPGLASLAFVNGEPAAFIASLSDINEFSRRKKSILGNSDVVRLLRFLINRKKQKQVRLLLFGIVEKYRKIGLDSVLFINSYKVAQPHGLERCEVSWLLETNDLVIKHGEAMGAKEYRRWRLYDYKL
jgi:hypothetical protein